MNDICNSVLTVKNYMRQIGMAARAATREVARASSRTKNTALQTMADAIRQRSSELLAANAADIADAKANGLDWAMIERLSLTAKGINKACEARQNQLHFE